MNASHFQNLFKLLKPLSNLYSIGNILEILSLLYHIVESPWAIMKFESVQKRKAYHVAIIREKKMLCCSFAMHFPFSIFHDCVCNDSSINTATEYGEIPFRYVTLSYVTIKLRKTTIEREKKMNK